MVGRSARGSQNHKSHVPINLVLQNLVIKQLTTCTWLPHNIKHGSLVSQKDDILPSVFSFLYVQDSVTTILQTFRQVLAGLDLPAGNSLGQFSIELFYILTDQFGVVNNEASHFDLLHNDEHEVLDGIWRGPVTRGHATFLDEDGNASDSRIMSKTYEY